MIWLRYDIVMISDLIHDVVKIWHCYTCSSLSVWVKNCDDLDLAACDRERLDSYIDDLYTSIEEADRVYDEDGMEIGK